MKVLQILFVFFPAFIWSQFQFVTSDSLTVISNNVELSMPFAGGLNYPQFSSIDYDFDGDLDLLVFDRSNNQIKVFEQQFNSVGSFYKYDPNGALLFPPDLRYRLFAIDYDADGRKDLFAYGIGGVKVYRNTGDNTSGLSWEVAKELLFSDNWGELLALYVSSSDIPAIIDVDFDGDIDVLTFHIGGEYLRYHKNMSRELYGHSDSLVFELKNECWGAFREDVSTNSVFLNDQTTPCTTGNVSDPEFPQFEHKIMAETKAHSGSTILALDIDGSGVMDLVLGDVAFSNLNLMINGGSDVNQNSAMISTDPLFPSNSLPVDMQLFPASYHLDVDFDGVKDLIVAPNAKNISENEKSVHFYKNAGTNEVSNFVFQQKDFLQVDMIEHGTGSIPVLSDVDGDGLIDLMIANIFSYKDVLDKESKIAYYKNTGSTSNPQFTLIDTDFQNLSDLELGLRMYPAFGDLNGDGKNDMILGLEDGTLSYFVNNSVGISPSYETPISNLKDASNTIIQNGLYAAPQLFDLNKDGLLDLIIGIKTGELTYYQNIGSTSEPSFELVTTLLGGIDVASTTPNGYPSPCFFSHNDTTYAIIGNVDGTLSFVSGIDGHIDDGDLFETIQENYLSVNVGAYTSATIADLNGDGFLQLLIGQDLGGLYYMKDDPNSNVGLHESLQKEFSVWPNPVNEELRIEFTDYNGETSAEVLNLMGGIVKKLEIKNKLTVFNISELNPGIYYLKLSNHASAIKFIKL